MVEWAMMRSGLVRLCISVMSLLALAVIDGHNPALAADPVAIGEIVGEPRPFHLKQVILQGTVRNVQPLDPYTLPGGSTCYGAYLFYLEDATAAINVAVFGICGVPLVKDPDVDEGARIELHATIQAPSHGGYYLSFQGLKVVGEREGIVQAVADRIIPLLDEAKPQ
jgi:hypothetical protein